MDPEVAVRDDAAILSEMAELQGLHVPAEELRPMATEEQLRYVTQRAVEAHLVPLGTEVHHIRQWLTLFKAHHEAALSYVPRAYPGTVTLLRAQEPRKTPVQPGRTLGWEAFSSRPVEVHDVPGDHESLFREPYLQPLAARLNGCIPAAGPTAPEPERR
jgi:thioesterase domain-containing protein